MNNPDFIIFENEITINNVTQLKEFSDKIFILDVNNKSYEIKGTNLILKEVTNNNKTLKILGEINSISKKNLSKDKNKNFIRKLFS